MRSERGNRSDLARCEVLAMIERDGNDPLPTDDKTPDRATDEASEGDDHNDDGSSGVPSGDGENEGAGTSVVGGPAA